MVIKNLTKTILLCCIFVAACQPTTGSMDHIPNTNIIYLSGDVDNPEIGFVNFDGSNNQTTSLNKTGVQIMMDSEQVYVLTWDGNYQRIGYWSKQDGLKTCQNEDWWKITSFDITQNQGDYYVLINNNGKWIGLIDIQTCTEIKRYVDLGSDKTKRLHGVSISSDGNQLAYSIANLANFKADYRIVLYSIFNGTSEIIGHGTNPVFSPDGKFIAIVSLDGLYIIEHETKISTLLLSRDFSDGLGLGQFNLDTPFLSWSPDSEWIIYSVCEQKSCDAPNDYNIFAVNRTNLEVVPVVEQGSNPFWRK